MKAEATVLLLSLALAGCQQKMGYHGHLRPYAPRPPGEAGALVRPIPDGAIARGHLPGSSAEERGIENGTLVREIPVPVTRRLLERGRERFNIYCAPCHGPGGDGDGMIVQRGFLAPPTYHQDRLRNAPAGHFFDVITHGFGAMYDYADRLDAPDRWAVVAYIRALQLSRNAPVARLTSDERKKLGGPR